MIFLFPVSTPHHAEEGRAPCPIYLLAAIFVLAIRPLVVLLYAVLLHLSTVVCAQLVTSPTITISYILLLHVCMCTYLDHLCIVVRARLVVAHNHELYSSSINMHVILLQARSQKNIRVPTGACTRLLYDSQIRIHSSTINNKQTDQRVCIYLIHNWVYPLNPRVNHLLYGWL